MKGLIEGYKRWNPVHPTYGAFWGIGAGMGCGIGWGPGFGPEAIGYVGAGCGIGFNVGFTLVGLGVGLPVNFLFQAPYNAIMARRGSALKLVRSSSLLSRNHFAGDGWTGIVPHVSELQREASEKFSNLPLLTSSVCESFRALPTRLLSSRRGLENQSSITRTSSATMQRTFGQVAPLVSNKPAPVLITPHCLKGHNYLQWPSSLTLFVHDRGNANYLSRSAALSGVDDPRYATWEAEKSMVQSWLVNSMTKNIGKNFLLNKIAHDVQRAAKGSYSSVKNKAILFDIECFLHDFKQGNLDVTQYYNVLVGHWQCLDLYETHRWYCEADAQNYNTLKEEKRVYKFLIGLNPIFEEIRNHIISLDPLPTLEEVFSEVKREECRKKLICNTHTACVVPESSPLLANGVQSDDYKLKKSERPQCEHCHEFGHTKEVYWKLRGRLANIKGSKPRLMDVNTW